MRAPRPALCAVCLGAPATTELLWPPNVSVQEKVSACAPCRTLRAGGEELADVVVQGSDAALLEALGPREAEPLWRRALQTRRAARG